jgi:predicted lipoprotein with Yx(FWY)xxD motif
MKIARLISVGAVAMLSIAACGSDDDSSDSPPADTGAAEATSPEAAAPSEAPAATDGAAPSGAAGLQLLDTSLGSVLGDAEGFTLYMFKPDAQGDSTCYEECEQNWPFVPEITDVGEGLDASLLGTTERTTGEVQATYNGWPLYLFGGDAGPGETNGQGVGDVWYVVDATGTPIE